MFGRGGGSDGGGREGSGGENGIKLGVVIINEHFEISPHSSDDPNAPIYFLPQATLDYLINDRSGGIPSPEGIEAQIEQRGWLLPSKSDFWKLEEVANNIQKGTKREFGFMCFLLNDRRVITSLICMSENQDTKEYWIENIGPALEKELTLMKGAFGNLADYSTYHCHPWDTYDTPTDPQDYRSTYSGFGRSSVIYNNGITRTIRFFYQNGENGARELYPPAGNSGFNLDELIRKIRGK